MQQVIDASSNGNGSGAVGRLGHGLGIQLTETPSLIDWDETVMQEGAVMTLEPSMAVPASTTDMAGVIPGILVHEENIVIQNGAPRLLSPRAPSELPVIGG